MMLPQQQHALGGTMRTTTTLIGALLALVAVTGCGSDDKADPGACKTALEQQYKDAANGKESSQRPAACIGVDDATLKKYVGEIMQDQLGKQIDDSLDSATPQP